MSHLGRIEQAIVKELNYDAMDHSSLYDSIRTSHFTRDTPKCISRHRIRSAIRSLKRRKLIIDQRGILSINE